jgi:hypothetical protein
MPSASSPKLYLNEHLSPRLAAQLRRDGFDVVSSREAELPSSPDSEQFAFAVSQHRAILTFNACDFIALHEIFVAEGKEHWGIVLSTQEAIWVLMRRLRRLLNSVSTAELKNQVRWLNEFA